MIERLECGSTIGMKATGLVTDDDYKTVLIPELEKQIKEKGKIRFLFQFGENFRGYELAALIDDFKLGIKHRSDFDRIAVVGGPLWIRLCTAAIAPFVSARVRYFEAQQLDHAWEWVAC
jgi:hypothetical protein